SEHYVQLAPRAQMPEPRLATIDSDFGIIRLPGVSQWLGFRDVLSKDGKPVSDRQRRLDSIFQDPSVNALAQARMVADESARQDEHTSELQSQSNLVCRLLLEKKKKKARQRQY